jgi:hypothetical protein
MDPVVMLEQFRRTVEDIKGGGAELLEEKNQLLQAILDCTSKNVYTINIFNSIFADFTKSSIFLMTKLILMVLEHICISTGARSFDLFNAHHVVFCILAG